jgi:hypothetical protein
MALVMFAEVCDDCATRMPEYEGGNLWSCIECGTEVCEVCIAVKVRPFCCGAPDCSQQRNEGICGECNDALHVAAVAGAPHLE